MLNGQPETLEEALALLQAKEQELQTMNKAIEQKDNLLKEKTQKLEEADLLHKQDTSEIKKQEILLNAKTKEIENTNKKLKTAHYKLNSKEEKLKESEKKLQNEKDRYKNLDKKYKELEEKFNLLKETMGIYNFNFWKSKTEKINSLDENNPYKASAGDEDGDAPEKKEKQKGGGRPNTRAKYNLPVRIFEDELTGDDKFCKICGTELKKVKKHSQDRLVHVPGYEYIERYIYYTYECPNCSGDEEATKAITSYEGSMVEAGIATPSLLSHVFVSKYLQHTPFYCQAEVYGWQNVNLCRQNFTKWQLKVYERLKPLNDLLFDMLKKSKYLMMDETPFKVQRINETERQAELWKKQSDNDLEKADKEEDEIEVSMKQCYIWLTLGEYNGHKI